MKKTAHQGNKSLKTVYLYFIIVFIIIFFALILKVIAIYQQSIYDPAHLFVLAVTQQKSVKEIIAFHPETPSLSILLIQDPHINYKNLAKDYGFVTDGYIETQQQINENTDPTSVLWASVMHTVSWQSNLTILDKIRLMLFVKNVSINNKNVEKISLINQTPDLNTTIATALNDQNISSENVTIQIINAANVSGLGQRLGRVLTNMGANVVDVSTSQKIQKKSTIAYFGNETYTVDRLQKFLGIPATKFTKQTIADIIIIIGTDKINTEEF